MSVYILILKSIFDALPETGKTEIVNLSVYDSETNIVIATVDGVENYIIEITRLNVLANQFLIGLKWYTRSEMKGFLSD